MCGDGMVGFVRTVHSVLVGVVLYCTQAVMVWLALYCTQCVVMAWL